MPFTWTRRIGAAWDTAHRSVPLSGAIATFSTDRQKFCVAFFSSPAFHPESTFTAPLIVTSSGFLPSPATDV
ncbi:hypothetical protein N8H10_10345 [Curtobacterium flaccumfaciens pv. poinsettiae]|uniref:hypothetical protein n=1 Tax=Curtobacterium poinsettiae TaxID=159612 RepID=UPI0021C609DE|nr:hypothetical protein [Curtobacterium flaccumfaciens]MCU0153181.1 hypothetical protein [Curtobacterium flaccumfaciens pv. poinsettiae]